MRFGLGLGLTAGIKRLPPGQTRARLLGSSAVNFLAQTAGTFVMAGSAFVQFVKDGSILTSAGAAATNFLMQTAGRFSISGAATAAFDAAALVAGAIGFWPMDTYTTSPRKAVPNAMSAVPVSANLFAGSRRVFNTAIGLWNNSSTTVADNAVNDPLGAQEASTSNGTGNWYISQNDATLVPAGTYTVAVNAKSNTGANQQFCFSGDGATTRSPVKTATTSWQRFSYTFTASGGQQVAQVMLLSIDGVTAANLQIVDLELYSGSSDLGPQTLAGHLYSGISGFNSTESYSGGYWSPSTGLGAIQFPSAQTLTAFTAMTVCSKVASGSSYQSFLSKIQSYTAFSAMMELTGAPAYNAGFNLNQLTSGLWRTLSVGAHVVGLRYDGTTVSFWLDDVILYQATASISSTAIEDLWVNLTNTVGGGLTSGYKFNSIALYNKALTDAEYRQNVTALTSRAASSGITLASERVYAATGDSITGRDGFDYPYLFGPNASPAILGADWGISGYGIADLVTQASLLDLVIPPNPGARKFILSVLIGANNQGLGSSAFLTSLASYLDARRTAGWKVVLCTLLPQTTVGFNAFRNAVNAGINGWAPGLHYDALADFAANGTVGIDGNGTTTGPWNTTNYSDGIHPTAAGQAILETIIRPVINAL